MGGDKASVEAARGAQAFIDACRSVRILETMTRQQRDELLAIMPDIGEPGYYFRAFNGKRNFAPPSDQSDWFKYKSIDLRNWRSEFEGDGDKVGVVTPWKYPKFEPPTITPADVDRIMAVIKAGGPWRADQRSQKEPWVGVPNARALGLDLLDRRAKKAVGECHRPAHGGSVEGDEAPGQAPRRQGLCRGRRGQMTTALNSDHGGPRSVRIYAIRRGYATTAVATTADHRNRAAVGFPFRGTTTATAAVWALGPSPSKPLSGPVPGEESSADP